MGRSGGVSGGRYQSFNLARWVGDEPSAVAENWRRFGAAYPAARTVARLQQMHGTTVHTIGAAWDSERREGDGMVTAAAGMTLGIFTADCVPILMVDAERRVCGAFHAGWRGTLGGIVAAGVCAMAALDARPQALRAAMGPAIGGCCFEVDAELVGQFACEIPGAREHTRPGRTGKAYMSLRSIIRDQLERAGLRREAIVCVGPCTRCGNDRFFSRRGGGGVATGLQMSFIGFAP
ncbi:MAG: peptidoglycan editing factor PgeF [Candidatus Binataceae bacterium]